MKKKNNKIVVSLAGTYEEGAQYIIARIADKNILQAIGNSEKFSKVIANEVVIVNTSAYRVKAANNPHLAKKLKGAGVDAWRIDGGAAAFVECKNITRINTRREYIVNIDTLEVKMKLAKTEAICARCHNIVNKTDLHGNFACTSCLLGNGDGRNETALAYRYGYHEFSGKYLLTEKPDEENTLYFGTEIERDYTADRYDNNFRENLESATLAVSDILYNNFKNANTQRDNVFMYDGSLINGGVEWITYPHTYAHYKKNADKIDAALETFNEFNFAASERTGNHIHINRSYFDGKNARDKDKSRLAAAKIALIFAEHWNAFCAIAQRDINRTGYTEQPTQRKTDNLFTLARKTLENEHEHNTAVNLQHAATIELRIFAGINSAADLLLYLDIASALAKYAKIKSLEKTQRATLADVMHYLTDKKTHLAEIINRLKEKDLAEEAKDLETYLATLDKAEA